MFKTLSEQQKAIIELVEDSEQEVLVTVCFVLEVGTLRSVAETDNMT